MINTSTANGTNNKKKWLKAVAVAVMTTMMSSSQSSSSSSSIFVEAVCPKISITNTECTDGSFRSSNLSSSCSDGSIDVSGTVRVASAFSTDDKVTFVPCLMWGAMCYPEYKQDGGNICDIITKDSSKTNSGGDSSCDGSTGTYSIVDGTSFPVPSEAEKYIGSSSMSFGVTVKVLVGGDEECTQESTVDNSAAFMGYGVASLLGVAGTALYFMKKRRRPLLVLEDADKSFVEMKDQEQHHYEPRPSQQQQQRDSAMV
mmetsp:Transcript_18098/g.43797  ORF Transcript_18098/g.43797 Transcript_18098/m.43797 type:complete len:258 (+) Transcript_18098:246-1019(+)